MINNRDDNYEDLIAINTVLGTLTRLINSHQESSEPLKLMLCKALELKSLIQLQNCSNEGMINANLLN